MINSNNFYCSTVPLLVSQREEAQAARDANIRASLNPLVGQHIRLHSLSTESLRTASLNGKRGIATGVDIERNCLIVKLEDGREVPVSKENVFLGAPACAKLDSRGGAPSPWAGSIPDAYHAF